MSDEFLTGILLDEREEISLKELAGICSCEEQWIIELVDEGVIEPRGQGPSEWRFTGTCLIRVRTAIRLHQDLDLNLAGVALAIDLLDEIDDLKSRLSLLEP